MKRTLIICLRPAARTAHACLPPHPKHEAYLGSVAAELPEWTLAPSVMSTHAVPDNHVPDRFLSDLGIQFCGPAGGKFQLWLHCGSHLELAAADEHPKELNDGNSGGTWSKQMVK